ncbi:hypothetical protein COCVIDRAFT_41105 [Bipolaris victoriae FI3]|uniref:Heterokaryon incompatibility domain-containing protein n=1 Tax=Bipolaris victoriae (strain FI3) TaxID=930091 RepID=W7E501_BIPV3|nr:hypothetical protein COCVIDRAFT_41105 [Bipolaris victoriae FI3]
MLCEVCTGALSQHKREDRTSRFGYLFSHHRSTKTLQQWDTHCLICTKLAKTLGPITDFSQDELLYILMVLYKEVSYSEKTDHRDHTMLNSQNLSGLTKTAQTWMNSCKCASFWEEPGAKWYPRRLLDLQELRASPDPHQTRIRLIESRDFIIGEETCIMSGYLPSKHQNDHYVTLSHCWGNPKLGSLPPLSMTFKNEKRFKTEDAVVFAAGLDKVGFIWIDSLCIRQPIKGDGENEEDQLQDWFEQTRHMGNLYRKAFLNISATAAYDVKGGLFFEPCPELLRENNIDVNYPEDPDTTLENGVEKTNPYARCSLIDPSAWDDLERLLAPRVLHFGYNQLAWECHKFNSSESYSWSELAMKPSSTPGFTDRSCLKHLTVSAGRSFREARIGDFRDRDTQIKDIYIYGLWKKIVESYSRTKLTEHNDKLTALGGIANFFMTNYSAQTTARHMSPDYGVATSKFNYYGPGPSWSWASITTPHGIAYNDITDYASPDDRCTKSLFFKVISHTLSPADPNNPFGILTSAHILLAPDHLHAINLIQHPNGSPIPCMWHLKSNSESRSQHDIHSIHLDASTSDTDIFDQDAQLYCMSAAYITSTIQSAVQELYILMLKYEDTVAFESSEPGKEKVEYRAFRRVGITNVAKFYDQEQEMLREGETQKVICFC